MKFEDVQKAKQLAEQYERYQGLLEVLGRAVNRMNKDPMVYGGYHGYVKVDNVEMALPEDMLTELLKHYMASAKFCLDEIEKM